MRKALPATSPLRGGEAHSDDSEAEEDSGDDRSGGKEKSAVAKEEAKAEAEVGDGATGAGSVPCDEPLRSANIGRGGVAGSVVSAPRGVSGVLGAEDEAAVLECAAALLGVTGEASSVGLAAGGWLTLLICFPVEDRQAISPSFHTCATTAEGASMCSDTPVLEMRAKQRLSSALVARSTSVFLLSMKSVTLRSGRLCRSSCGRAEATKALHQ